jgi:hypothetical protein
MAASLRCPECRNDAVVRCSPDSLAERLLTLLGLSPFQCHLCSRRFWAFRMGKSPRPPQDDRRAHRRIPVRFSMAFSGGRIQGKGTVLNLSVGGCMVESQTVVRVDEICYLRLYPDGQGTPVEVAAMVRSVGSMRIGFKFLRSAREDKRLLEFLRTHAGGEESRLGPQSKP